MHDPLQIEGVPPLFQRHSPTSSAAAMSVRPTSDAMRQRVLNAIRDAADGLTDEEGMEVTGLQGSTYRPRRIEAVMAHRVRDSGRTRPGRSGRQMTIWIAK